MTSSNGNGADPNAEIFTPARMTPAFDPAALTAFWMSSSARVMRSSEVFMRGMTEVARLEAELGQHFLQRSITGLQTPMLGTNPDQQARERIEQTTQSVDSLLTTMRKIADEFRQTVAESTQALFDLDSPAKQESVAASVHLDDPAVRRRAARGMAAQEP